MANKLLFFVNNLNRTGSETLALNLINDLNKQKELEIGVVLFQKGGELLQELDRNIPVFYLDMAFSTREKILFHLGVDIIGGKIHKIQNQFGASAWYFNTINQVGLLKYKDRYSCKAFVHVHELLYNFELMKAEELRLLLAHADHLIACSELVKELFFPYFKNPITIVNSTVDPLPIIQHKRSASHPTNQKIQVISSGSICHRKGVDLFYEVARILQNKGFEFVWLGRAGSSAYAEIIRLKNQETNVVQFLQTSSQEEYLRLFSQANIFLSTSREESMGLVLMEAIALEIPILATNSGGSMLIVDESVGQICHDQRPEIIAKELEKMANQLDQFSFSKGPKYLYAEELEKLIQVVR
jgi:glycosyltransferase involved in cell wall biosynthesis